MFVRSPIASTACLVVGIFGLLAFLDGRDWQLQMWAWSRRLSASTELSASAMRGLGDDSGPEDVFLMQLRTIGDDHLAAATLHSGLAALYDRLGQAEKALSHYKLACVSASLAAEGAAPPRRAGHAIIAVAKEKETLAETRLALARAYGKRGNAADAERELGLILQDTTFVGLETLQLAETLRELGHVKVKLGRPSDALRYYKMAKSRVENSVDDDVAAWEIFHGLLEEEAAAAAMPQQPTRLRGHQSNPKHMGKLPTSTATAVKNPQHLEVTSSLEARVMQLLAQGNHKQAEKDCLTAIGSTGESNAALSQLRVLLGRILNHQGRALEARKQFTLALTGILKASAQGNADLQVTRSAYDGLYETQNILHDEGTRESETAAKAIFREAQRIAYEEDAPLSTVRQEGELQLRTNASRYSKEAAASPVAQHVAYTIDV